MNTDFDRFNAFFQTSSFWNGTLGGLKQFPLSNFNFDHFKNQQEQLELPEIPVRTVLGKQAEYLFKFCADSSSNYKVLASNIQIFNGKRTIGEIDYLLQHQKSKNIYHVELVYKFYIFEPGKSFESSHLTNFQNQELSCYVGPNRRDHFIKKFDHLKNQQLPLLQLPETVEHLGSLGVDVDQIKQQVCFLAHVYIPREMWNHDFKYLNKSCIKGYYVDEHAFAKAETSNIYFIPKKKQWKLQPQELETSYSFQEAKVEINKKLNRDFAPMVWKKLDDGTIESFFVVKSLSTL